MSIDPCTSVAFAVHGRPGAYALLLGSGLSTAAGIPTGWQVVERLIEQLAVVEKRDVEGAPADWYQATYGQAPTYSGLVGRLALAPADRHALINRLLDLGNGADERQPTAAHRAIARLMRDGFVRVIITTNFDPLLERALASEGVHPTVLASPDAIGGALPLAHLDRVLVKLHGDHLDPRIRNTDAELDQYEPEVDRFLDELFDTFGLIVVGWSADHDTALRSALDRCRTRRFSTYWASMGGLSPGAEALVRRREAEVVPIVDADDFLGRLSDGCQALADLDRDHPLSIDADVQAAKREFAGGHLAISLHDRVVAEFERLRRHELWASPVFSGGGPEIMRRAGVALVELERTAALVAVLAYWGDESTDQWWWPEIERFGKGPEAGGDTGLLDLLRTPALVVLWSAGIAAVLNERYDLLARMMDEPLIPNRYGEHRLPAVLEVTPQVLHVGYAMPMLFKLLRTAIGDRLGLGHEAFLEGWERWQYLLAVRDRDERLTANTGGSIQPVLRINSRRIDGPDIVVGPWLRQDAPRSAGKHPIVEAGAFGGDPARLDTARTTYDELYTRDAFRQDTPGSSGTLPTGTHFPGCTHADADRWLKEAHGPQAAALG